MLKKYYLKTTATGFILLTRDCKPEIHKPVCIHTFSVLLLERIGPVNKINLVICIGVIQSKNQEFAVAKTISETVSD